MADSASIEKLVAELEELDSKLRSSIQSIKHIRINMSDTWRGIDWSDVREDKREHLEAEYEKAQKQVNESEIIVQNARNVISDKVVQVLEPVGLGSDGFTASFAASAGLIATDDKKRFNPLTVFENYGKAKQQLNDAETSFKSVREKQKNGAENPGEIYQAERDVELAKKNLQAWRSRKSAVASIAVGIVAGGAALGIMALTGPVSLGVGYAIGKATHDVGKPIYDAYLRVQEKHNGSTQSKRDIVQKVWEELRNANPGEGSWDSALKGGWSLVGIALEGIGPPGLGKAIEMAGKLAVSSKNVYETVEKASQEGKDASAFEVAVAFKSWFADLVGLAGLAPGMELLKDFPSAQVSAALLGTFDSVDIEGPGWFAEIIAASPLSNIPFQEITNVFAQAIVDSAFHLADEAAVVAFNTKQAMDGQVSRETTRTIESLRQRNEKIKKARETAQRT